MNILSKIKFCILAFLGFLFLATPAYASVPSKVATRSNEVKMKVCEVKKEAVRTRTDNLIKMSENMLGVFDKIETRVEDFYQNKVLPGGGKVSNYDSLVKTMDSKRDAVSTALQKAEDTAGSFSCDNPNPKDTLTSFRKDMQAVKGALKEYRTSIKNLIVAVHGSAKTLKESPKPTKAGN